MSHQNNNLQWLAPRTLGYLGLLYWDQDWQLSGRQFHTTYIIKNPPRDDIKWKDSEIRSKAVHHGLTAGWILHVIKVWRLRGTHSVNTKLSFTQTALFICTVCELTSLYQPQTETSCNTWSHFLSFFQKLDSRSQPRVHSRLWIGTSGLPCGILLFISFSHLMLLSWGGGEGGTEPWGAADCFTLLPTISSDYVSMQRS